MLLRAGQKEALSWIYDWNGSIRLPCLIFSKRVVWNLTANGCVQREHGLMELLQLFLAVYRCTFLEFHLRGKSKTTSYSVTHSSKLFKVLKALEVNWVITKLALAFLTWPADFILFIWRSWENCDQKAKAGAVFWRYSYLTAEGLLELKAWSPLVWVKSAVGRRAALIRGEVSGVWPWRPSPAASLACAGGLGLKQYPPPWNLTFMAGQGHENFCLNHERWAAGCIFQAGIFWWKYSVSV